VVLLAEMPAPELAMASRAGPVPAVWAATAGEPLYRFLS
jgi:hypothetical protein